MKIFIGFLLLLFSFNAFSQSATEFYFDKDMNPGEKKKAAISGTGSMDSGLYKITCYYLKRKHPLACVSHFTDSTQTKRQGSYRFFFENGKIQTEGNYNNNNKEGCWANYNEKGILIDSIIYKNGIVISRTGFYDLPLNHQRLMTIDDVANNTFYTKLYNGHGDIVSQNETPQDYNGFYFGSETAPSFPGGPLEWSRYISKILMSHIEDFSRDDRGTVLLRFVVDTAGKISSVRPLTLSTSKLAMIAFNAIDGGPNWIPAEHTGKKVKTIMIQPVILGGKN